MLPTFAHPWALPLLLLVPLLLWRWRRRPRVAWTFSDLRLLPVEGGRRARWAQRGGLLLRGAGLTALVLALTGPRWPDESSRIPTEGITAALVLDVSGSMGEVDFPWDDEKVSRLEGVRRAFRLFVVGGRGPGGVELTGRPNDLLALVTFATRPETACPPTLDHRALLQILDEQKAREGSGEATTNPGDALAWALAVLQRAPTRRKVILFLTDGESNVPGSLTPRQAAQLAGNLGVPIYALDASPEAPDPSEAEGVQKARATLHALATMTHGATFRAGDGAALASACAAIDRLERDPLPSPQFRRWHDAYPWFALAALTCWSAALLLEATRWRQTP